MGYEFDAQTAVLASGAGRYDAEIDAGWTVGGGVNGGYALAILGNAIAAELPDKPDPLSVSAYFLSPTQPGPAKVDVAVRRNGGTVATVAADLRHGDDARITALATYGTLRDNADDVRTTAAEFELPPPEECFHMSESAPEEMRKSAPLMARYDMRAPLDDLGWSVGRPSGRGVVQAWVRMADGRDPDPVELLAVVDVLPPTTFDLGMPGWAPTLELTAHIRAHPAPGWLKVRHQTQNLAGGMFEEDCEVWDSAGRLVAQSRQLALTPR